jgi:hypothetical protein
MDEGVKMSENAGNESGIGQENSEKSENTQPIIETNSENTSHEAPSEGHEAPSEHENADSSEGDELHLPEPDIIEDENKKKKEPPEWLKKKLERDRVAAERKAQEADTLRQENERLRAGMQQPNVQQPQVPQNQQTAFDPYMPQREQYPDDASYFLALSDYRDHRRSVEAQFHQRQAAIKEHEEAFHKNLEGAIESGKSKYKDFAERTDYILYGEGFPSNRAMAEAIVESSYKDDILYFLGTHVKEAERIARLNPVQAAKEIARIEVRFDSRKKSNITKAPKVLTPLTGGKGSATHGDPNKMGMDDFRNWYEGKYGKR